MSHYGRFSCSSLLAQDCVYSVQYLLQFAAGPFNNNSKQLFYFFKLVFIVYESKREEEVDSSWTMVLCKIVWYCFKMVWYYSVITILLKCKIARMYYFYAQ